MSLMEGVGTDFSGDESKPTSFTVGYARPLTRVENLTAWWTFDEASGTTVTDYMNGYVGQFVSGDGGMTNVSFDSANAKFGSALRFPTNAWVETDAFASNLGIGGGSKRTISFWLYAENGNSGNRGPYGIGQRGCPNSTHLMWGIRGFGMGTYAVFEASIGAGILMFGYLRGCGINGFILPIYTGTNVQVYVNGTQAATGLRMT